MSQRIFTYPIRVADDAIDRLGHVNNCEYLRWMEAAATAHAAARRMSRFMRSWYLGFVSDYAF